MKKIIKKIIYVFLLLTLILGFSSSTVFAGEDLTLEKISDCNLAYMGDSCLIEMKVTNNSGSILNGKLDVGVSYEDESFDGEGMIIRFLPSVSSGWLNSSNWDSGNIFFHNFDIEKDETIVFVEINTHPALYSGEYTLILSLIGTSESGENYESKVVPTSYSGGGGNGIPGTTTAPQKGEDGIFSFLEIPIPTEILEEIKKLPDTVIEEIANFVRENPNYFGGVGLVSQEGNNEIVLPEATTTENTLDENQLATIIDSGVGQKIIDFLQPIATSPATLVIIFILIVIIIRRQFFF